MNYILIMVFYDVMGEYLIELVDFFKMYSGDMKFNSNKRVKWFYW